MAPGEDINKLYRISAAVHLMLLVIVDSSSVLIKKMKHIAYKISI